jgi:hypothetical protein
MPESASSEAFFCHFFYALNNPNQDIHKINIRYVNYKLDECIAAWHDASVSSILLQGNRFQPAFISGLFFPQRLRTLTFRPPPARFMGFDCALTLQHAISNGKNA